MNKKVAIVLVNYQDYATRFLLACRDSLRRQNYPADQISIYIVDNVSCPESLKYLQDNFPEALILPRSDGNYAAANNLGFKQAIQDACQYLVTLNMDTELDANWLQELVLALDQNPQAGIAQSKILLAPATNQHSSEMKINSLGNIINFLGFGFTSAYGEADREIKDYPEIQGYASGCSFIIRRETFEKIGAYNEEFYMYHDDLELSLKTRLAGQQIILAPRSRVFHKYEFSRSVQMLYYLERNRYLLIFTFYPGYLLFLIVLPLIIMDGGLLFFSILKGWFNTKKKVYRYFCSYRNYVKIIQERRRIKKFKIVPFSALAQHFSGRIEFQEIANPLLNNVVNPVFSAYWSLIKKLF